MRPKVGCVGEVGIEGGRAHVVLQPGEPRRLPADNGYEALAQGVAPGGQSSSICSALSLRLGQLHPAGTHSGRGDGFPHPAASPCGPGRSRAHQAGVAWQQSAGECREAGRAIMASTGGVDAVDAVDARRAARGRALELGTWR
jgi:hypothetical protein